MYCLFLVANMPPMFIEEQQTATQVFDGNLVISDPDHPMYLMERARVSILGGQRQYEILSLNETFDSLTATVS